MENYLKIYSDFIEKFNHQEVGAKEVGDMVVLMAHYYAEATLKSVEAQNKYFLKLKEVQMGTDEDTHKPISSAKAEIIANASEEGCAFRVLRSHVQNLEQIINALKSLQKGVLKEYDHVA